MADLYTQKRAKWMTYGGRDFKVNHRSTATTSYRTFRRWLAYPMMMPMAYNAERLFQLATDNPYLTWKQVALLIPALRECSAMKLPHDRRIVGYQVPKQRLRIFGDDVAYVVQTYCTVWGGFFPYRKR